MELVLALVGKFLIECGDLIERGGLFFVNGAEGIEENLSVDITYKEKLTATQIAKIYSTLGDIFIVDGANGRSITGRILLPKE